MKRQLPAPPQPPKRLEVVADARGQGLARLQAASDQLGLALTVPQTQGLMDYLALLQRWNKVYNLTALRDPGEMFSHHLLDCLAAMPPLRRWLSHAAGPTPRLLDVGSGAGLPGVLLALLQPAWTVHCVDTVSKKAGFIRQVAAELRLPNLQSLHARVEALQPDRGGYDVITSRAFASLLDFTTLSARLLASRGVWMAMKGKPPTAELSHLPPSVTVFHVEQLQVPGLDAQRCLVWMRPASAGLSA